MGKWAQRIRGAIGIGLTWAIGWSAIGVVLGLVVSIVANFPMLLVVKNYGTSFGLLGFLAGVIFSLLLSFAERKRNFEQLSAARFTLWGALGGLVLATMSIAIGMFGAGIDQVSMVVSSVIGTTFTVLGAGFAAGTLGLARGAPQATLKQGDPASRELTGALK